MPENTDFGALKCHFENNLLVIDAPVNPELEKSHQIPIVAIFVRKFVITNTAKVKQPT